MAVPGERKEDRSIGQLLKELTQESSTLLKQEVNLAKTEMSEKASRIGFDWPGLAGVRAKLDELAGKLKADPAGNFIEIEGHTDATGSPTTNDRLGLARAENVKRYLYETYQIPLHKINVISYGEDKPAAPNKTRDGRAQNRRVVIKVLA